MYDCYWWRNKDKDEKEEDIGGIGMTNHDR